LELIQVAVVSVSSIELQDQDSITLGHPWKLKTVTSLGPRNEKMKMLVKIQDLDSMTRY